MTFDDILQDIYALEDEMRTYERKYGVLSETFYELYMNGDEPPHSQVMGIGVTDEKVLVDVMKEIQNRFNGKVYAASFKRLFSDRH